MNLNECPYCGKGIDPRILNETDIGQDRYAGIYECPICDAVYFGKLQNCGSYNENNYLAYEIWPNTKASEVSFSSYIQQISPQFISIYNQALQAEISGFNDIYGLGYRKALEYLIKDFLIFLDPDKADEIKKDNKLSNVIANRIPPKIHFDDLKQFANFSWWLGSDETHYYKKYDLQETAELKTCVDIVVTEIDYYLKKQDLVSKIQKK